ncbi:MAG TPA: Gfo/Idh/MocA family oxidoreductase, partial [Rhizobiaceae bacterium]|nr:Gfo/Idh/MocA family oxidoreductase [Rhizobiaceae bacterium]
MKFAIVGTGFVADYYMTTLPNHPDLQLAGAWDIAPDALRRFCAFHGAKPRASLDDILCDPEVAIVANLTAPESHFAVTKAALEAGKHVYSEKPLTLSFDDASELAACASRNGLALCSSPASVHSAAFALTRETIASGAIGEPRLIYAEMEDGPVFRDKWREWRSISGAPWPGVHEFEIGCTLEHAGYALAWLVDLFGPVEKLTAFSATAFPDKG